MDLGRHNSGAESTRELFKRSKDSASLVVCNAKNFLVLGFGFFVSDIISGVLLDHFEPLYLALSPKEWSCYVTIAKKFSNKVARFGDSNKKHYSYVKRIRQNGSEKFTK